jgi:hypothetical protein
MVRIRESADRVKEGMQFGNWTVIGPPFSRGGHQWAVVARCSCGRVAVVRTKHIARGDSKGCLSCHSSELHTTHGGAGGKRWKRQRLYTIWHRMLQRCERPEYPRYEEWGGRGIRVCEEWHDYAIFREWAIANGYDDSLSIDRHPNNDGNYEPENCRWANAKQQSRNTRRNLLLTFQGITLCMAEWSERTGIKVATIQRRLKSNWPIEAVLTEKPVQDRSDARRRKRQQGSSDERNNQPSDGHA